jgi:hypothetical protein
MWKKILLGILAVIVLAIVLAFVFTKSLPEVANKQLEALHNGNITAAYSYTSKDFQANTSMADFDKFVNRFPSLKNNKKTSWSSREISNNTGTLIGSLTATDGGVTPIEYHFVKENNEWKILSIQTKATGAQTSDAQSQSKSVAKITNDISQGAIHHVAIRDTYDSKLDKVIETKAIIPANTPKIYAVVYISHAKAGLKVAAQLVRIANSAKIGPVVAKITQTGNVIRNFSFTNTDPTWPVGDYRVNVMTSNGQWATVPFKIQ